MITVCYKCDRRTPTCHVDCETYINAKEKHDAEREDILKRYHVQAALTEHEFNTFRKIKKGRNHSQKI